MTPHFTNEPPYKFYLLEPANVYVSGRTTFAPRYVVLLVTPPAHIVF